MAFIRYVKVEIREGETVDLRKKPVLVLISDGSANSYHIDFEVSKELAGASPNLSQVTIHNLSRQTISFLTDINSVKNIAIYVGHIDGQISLLSSGNIRQCIPNKAQIENSLAIFFFHHWYSFKDTVASVTFEGYTTLQQRIFQLANLMKKQDSGLIVDMNEINVTDKIIPEKTAVQGKVRTLLTEMAWQHRFYWNIQDSVFYAVSDGFTRKRAKLFEVSVANRNLLSCTPSYIDNSNRQNGIEIEAFLDTGLACGDFVDLKSSFYANANGKYIVTGIVYRGSTSGADWKMTIQSCTPAPIKRI